MQTEQHALTEFQSAYLLASALKEHNPYPGMRDVRLIHASKFALTAFHPDW